MTNIEVALIETTLLQVIAFVFLLAGNTFVATAAIAASFIMLIVLALYVGLY